MANPQIIVLLRIDDLTVRNKLAQAPVDNLLRRTWIAASELTLLLAKTGQAMALGMTILLRLCEEAAKGGRRGNLCELAPGCPPALERAKA